MMKRYYTFFAVLALICALAITSNMLLRRGPVHDAVAANDIRQLQAYVDTYYFSQNQLPTTLNQVKVIDDDVTKRLADYDYRPTGPLTYELCTTFQTRHRSTNSYYAKTAGGIEVPDPDNHDQGRQCFSYTIIPIQSPYPAR